MKGRNWNKSPWYCPECTAGQAGQETPSILVTHPPTSQHRALLPNSQSPHDPAAHPALQPPRLSPLQEDNSIIEFNRVLYQPHGSSWNTNAPVFLPAATPSAPPVPSSTANPAPTIIPQPGPIPSHRGVLHTPQVDHLPENWLLHPRINLPNPQTASNPDPRTVSGPAIPVASSSTVQPVFPSNSTRQRTSNVPVTDPLREFEKTALDSCRATVIQQEADLKRANEALDVRNKRIMLLDSQVGIATAHMTSRDMGTGGDIPATTVESLSKVIESMNLVLAKIVTMIDQLSPRTQSVNVYNNSCQNHKSDSRDEASQTTQEPSKYPTTATIDPSNNNSNIAEETVEDHEVILQCTVCNKILSSQAHLDSHIECVHGQVPPKPATPADNMACDFCDAAFLSAGDLDNHISRKHATEFLQCPGCMFRFQSKSKLSDHVKICHGSSSSNLQPLSTQPSSAQPSSAQPSSAQPLSKPNPSPLSNPPLNSSPQSSNISTPLSSSKSSKNL